MTCHPEGYKCLGDPLAEALGDSMVATDGNYSWRDLDPGYHRDLLYRAERVRKSLATRGLAVALTEAGRLLMEKNTSRDRATNEWLLNDILAIEREASERATAAVDVDSLRTALTDALETFRVVARGEALHPRIRPSVLRQHIGEIEGLLRAARPSSERATAAVDVERCYQSLSEALTKIERLEEAAAVDVPVGLRAALEHGVLLPDPEGDGWHDEVRITKGDLHELLNRHAVARVNAALAEIARLSGESE